MRTVQSFDPLHATLDCTMKNPKCAIPSTLYTLSSYFTRTIFLVSTTL